jgi:hypothetical protein
MRFPFLTVLAAVLLVPTACAQDDMADEMGADMPGDGVFMDAPPRASDEARPSPNAYVGTTVGTTDVLVQYGRPSLRGRSYFTDGAELAPAGEVWRTGANEAATVTFSGDVTFGGEAVPAGTYALFAIPGDGEWTVILNDVAEQWGAFRYDEAEDRVRVTAEPMTDAPMEEQFEIRFEDVSEDAAVMVLHWGTVGVPVTIATGA